MKKTNKTKSSATIKKALDAYLKLDANSASSTILYQEKAPKSLERFKRKK
ncbi:MAG: cyclic lactone autoinducer peptide [Lachnospiraceae bacterium]|nr:cyclic lactone autoinducer peptide [Lachnospiraceae bacterium]